MTTTRNAVALEARSDPARLEGVPLADRAYALVVCLASLRRAFTSDDAWDALDAYAREERREIANAFLRAERAGVIVNSGLGVYVRGRQAHRRWIAVWLSHPLAASTQYAIAYARHVASARSAHPA